MSRYSLCDLDRFYFTIATQRFLVRFNGICEDTIRFVSSRMKNTICKSCQSKEK